MASFLPSSDYPEFQAALLDVKSPLLVKARKQTGFLFDYTSDLCHTPLTEEEKAKPGLETPLLGSQEILKLVCDRLRGHGMSLDECEVVLSSVEYKPHPIPGSNDNETTVPPDRRQKMAVKLSNLTRRLARRGSGLFSKKVSRSSSTSATSPLPSVIEGKDSSASAYTGADEAIGGSGRAGQLHLRAASALNNAGE